jgi:hypothetical protein
MTESLAERCAAVEVTLKRSVEAAGLENEGLGHLINALADVPGLFPSLVQEVRASASAPLDNERVARAVRNSVDKAMAGAVAAYSRRGLAMLVMGAVGLAAVCGASGFLLGRDQARQDVAALGQYLSLGGPEARVWLTLIQANPAIMETMKGAQGWRDERTGGEVVRPSLWRWQPTPPPVR